jgi:hypothetical protein
MITLAQAKLVRVIAKADNRTAASGDEITAIFASEVFASNGSGLYVYWPDLDKKTLTPEPLRPVLDRYYIARKSSSHNLQAGMEESIEALCYGFTKHDDSLDSPQQVKKALDELFAKVELRLVSRSDSPGYHDYTEELWHKEGEHPYFKVLFTFSDLVEVQAVLLKDVLRVVYALDFVQRFNKEADAEFAAQAQTSGTDKSALPEPQTIDAVAQVLGRHSSLIEAGIAVDRKGEVLSVDGVRSPELSLPVDLVTTQVTEEAVVEVAQGPTVNEEAPVAEYDPMLGVVPKNEGVPEQQVAPEQGSSDHEYEYVNGVPSSSLQDTWLSKSFRFMDHGGAWIVIGLLVLGLVALYVKGRSAILDSLETVPPQIQVVSVEKRAVPQKTTQEKPVYIPQCVRIASIGGKPPEAKTLSCERGYVGVIRLSGEMECWKEYNLLPGESICSGV